MSGMCAPSHLTRSGNKDHTGKHVPMDGQKLTYGTAGFRTKLDFIYYSAEVTRHLVSDKIDEIMC